jgi:hypothetical protein
MDTYDVNQYSDDQLYDILDMNHPSDRELEAKIIQMMRKYENIPSQIGRQLYTFFDNMYKRFFDTETEEEDENLIEGFETPPPPKTQTITNPDETPLPTGPITKKVGYQAQNIASVQQFNYSPDKLQLNPLLQQTIKRVISIDSQYRNITTYPNTTNFSFDLSEPLRDVVSLKLYSVQIPYTWYTVGKSYGSNFFYLRGNAPGNTNENYKIAIAPGNYNQDTLITEINKSFQDVSNGPAADINFNGLSLLTYNSSTARTTVNLNMTNTFNETYYTLTYPFFTHPLDLSNNSKSIPGYLGFNSQSYSMSSIYSNQQYKTTQAISSQGTPDFYLDNSNNYFTVVQYIGYDPFSGYDINSKTLNQFTVQLTNNGLPYIGNVTRQTIIDLVNQAIQSSPFLDTTSNIKAISITDLNDQNYGYTYFQLTIIPNRNTVKYVPNAKVVVIFPNETPRLNQYSKSYTIWQLQPALDWCCFYFDNVMNQFSQIISETPTIQSTFQVDTSTNMVMTCATQGFQTVLNNYTMRIPTGTYNVSQFLNQITTSFSNQNTPTNTYFNTTNTTAFLDTTNVFNLQIDLTRDFTNKNYKTLIDGNSFLNKPNNNFTITYNIVNTPGHTSSTNLYDISYINIRIPKKTNYNIDVSCIMYIQPDSSTYGNGGNGGSDTIPVCMPYLSYSTYQVFITSLQTAFYSTIYSTPINTQTPLSKTTVSYYTTDPDYIDISLNLNCYYFLTEKNYDISFADYTYTMSNTKNVWKPFNIYSFYDLSTNISASGFADISGYQPVDNSITKQIILYDNCNNSITFSTNNPTAPSETITIDISAATYTTIPLYAAINKAFSNNPRTYGSYIQSIAKNGLEYSYLWININHVYTTQDYILDFYDPVNFVSCYAGATSVQNTTWDSTIGWMLGFRDYTQYVLTQANQTTVTNNSIKSSYYLQSSNGIYIITPTTNTTSNLTTNVLVQLTGDTSLSTNLYNYFLISLDDFIQNHLNDGLVTITRSQTSIQIPDYAYSTTQSCDPSTGQLVATSTKQSNSDNVTQNQLYAQNQAITSQQPTTKEYSPGPFIKDLFGIIPIKPPAKAGDYYTEFGGTLQNQERLYFGPVNIRKMSIQLLTDRGTVVDLNNSNWSFSFVCEQLYRASST